MDKQDKRTKRETKELNGAWEIQPGDRDISPITFEHRVHVPALVDCAAPSYDWQESRFHWYRRTFYVEADKLNYLAFLKIEQSMFGTAVWVNGTFVGESISCYTSQEYRIDNYLNCGAENQIVVRVGQKSTLPPESAVGKDLERLSFIPGIWGDVRLIFTKRVRVKLIQAIPHIDTSNVEVNVWLENYYDAQQTIILRGAVSEKKSGAVSSAVCSKVAELGPRAEGKITLFLQVENMKLWSPESPFLYLFTAKIEDESGIPLDEESVTFGMREFMVRGSSFYLNGKKIYLRGSNIAFHRFLSDKDRKLLPWDSKWIQKIFVDIPKSHNFNFFRAHLGHMYNKWYDIADEGGILLQDEWQFWGATGTKEQITKEFSEWLKDNWNHPSIVIWDPLNESTDETVQNEIVPRMKELDPTRPWESHDFFEDHPYIYSLGPVLVDRKFGFTRSLDTIGNSRYPSQVNEYLWWWLDKDFKPSELTKKVVSRWLGNDYTEKGLVDHQSFLASELTELFRRLDVKCIQPFVYLSTNDGPTSHWFVDNIADLKPKPILAALKNAFEPFGVSIELWDRHFFCGEKRNFALYVFNDYPHESNGRLKFGIKDMSGNWTSFEETSVSVVESDRKIITLSVNFPKDSDDYFVCAELTDSQTGRKAVSEKIVYIYDSIEIPSVLKSAKIGVIDKDDEISDFLKSMGVNVYRIENNFDETCDLLLVAGSSVSRSAYDSMREEITRWANEGRSVIFVEPERNILQKETFVLPGGQVMSVEPRVDHDQGGYDSYLIVDDIDYPLWEGLRKTDLRMFNGAYGGEIVPQSDLKIEGSYKVLARSGLSLSRLVVLEGKLRKGLVVVSSVELHGRLIPKQGCYAELYARRPDPVAQRFLLNLIAHGIRSQKNQSSPKGEKHKSIVEK